MRSAVTHRIFIATFLLLTLLPGLQMLTRLAPEFEVDEQRTLAKAPSIEQPDRYLRQANTWFAEHYGFRSLLIRIKGTIDYRVFGVSDKVHVGRDGYLFYRGTLDVEKPAIEAYLATHEAAVVDGVRRYADALQQNGIGMVMVVNLLGDRFIPENLPTSVAAREPMRRIDHLIGELSTIPNLSFIDSTALLQQTSQSRPIFHRTDFHWNDPAAFPVAKAIVDNMSRAEGLDRSVWTHQLVTQAHTFSGGIARFMPLLNPPNEVSLFTQPNWRWPQGFTSTLTESPYEEITRTTPGTPGLLHPVLLVGDSFLDALNRNGFTAYFSETYRLRWTTTLTLPAISDAIPRDARWVVVQFIEVAGPALRAFSEPEQVTAAIAKLKQRRP
ncbi:hypothetical protein QN397_03620 [Variovorax sp. RTB1]|uniref:alginate O-acetyltransferase AlgX-related protein n=1 Tax=Variovorax sp. RTB1 TaxID=3048631 RepID=UPI002B224266|nr:hypothetical protein [Variovorax sp. RTB1]MEB0110443.1 hypothetical protein [Variovorax sp. RTB1]